MSQVVQTCSICHSEFEIQFRYQMEERLEVDGHGGKQPRAHYFCTQRCLEASHAQEADGRVRCDACTAHFSVELASQVLFSAGKRHYACGLACRSKIQAGLRALPLAERLGETAPVALPPTQGPANDAGVPVSWRRVDAALRSGPRILAVFNHKGGTGKTTSAVTVAAGLAARGRKVLLVDTDGQGNVAVSLGLQPERTLYHVLVLGTPPKDAVIEARPGLDVLAANETLAAAELYLAGRRHRDRVLATRLGEAARSYDHVILDCSPSLSLMNQNALVFAEGVLCPVACDYLSLVGVRQVVRTVKQVNKLLDHPVRFWGILPTLYDSRARICREALQTLEEHFGNRCLPPIRRSVKAQEAPSQGKTLLEYAPDSRVYQDYQSTVQRLLDELREVPRTAAGGIQ